MSEGGRERLRAWGTQTAIILGSGLNALVRPIPNEPSISFAEFPELPRATVAGHEGQFALGEINGHRVIYAQGRVHLYEGNSALEVTAGIRLLRDCGLRRVILTNAAGSLNPAFEPGSWMMICDHLNLTGASPLIGAPKFIDMGDVYSERMRKCVSEVAREEGITLHQGVYAGVLGPQYETPAEVRMLRQLGADAVGMSTVLEAIEAHALGMEVCAFSCLTNWAAGIGADSLSHADVLAMGKTSATDLARLLAAALD